MCKIGKWRCPYLDPYDYFVIVDKSGKEINKSFKKKDLEKKLLPEEGQKIEERKYDGCPRHKHPKVTNNILDMFS